MNKKGFTLIELMIVVAIIGILGAIAAPNVIGQLPERNLSRAARDMVSNFRKARAMAIKLNRNVEIEFKVAEGTYSVNGKTFPDKDETLRSHYGSGITMGYPGRSDPVTFPDDKVSFNTMGLLTNTAAQDCYVYLQNSKKQGYRIGVQGMATRIVMESCTAQGVDCTK